jgi:hypothetical protein
MLLIDRAQGSTRKFRRLFFFLIFDSAWVALQARRSSKRSAPEPDSNFRLQTAVTSTELPQIPWSTNKATPGRNQVLSPTPMSVRFASIFTAVGLPIHQPDPRLLISTLWILTICQIRGPSQISRSFTNLLSRQASLQRNVPMSHDQQGQSINSSVNLPANTIQQCNRAILVTPSNQHNSTEYSSSETRTHKLHKTQFLLQEARLHAQEFSAFKLHWCCALREREKNGREKWIKDRRMGWSEARRVATATLRSRSSPYPQFQFLFLFLPFLYLLLFHLLLYFQLTTYFNGFESFPHLGDKISLFLR